MKTLDEVIENLGDGTEHLSAMLISKETWNDALHYLKVLKDILDPLKVKKISHEITCPQCNSVIAILLPESNEPLAWDELKIMEGFPVWVEEYDPIDDNKGWHRCRWYLVNFVNDEYFYVCDNDGEENHFCLAEIGKTWTAYRKEKKCQ